MGTNSLGTTEVTDMCPSLHPVASSCWGTAAAPGGPWQHMPHRSPSCSVLQPRHPSRKGRPAGSGSAHPGPCPVVSGPPAPWWLPGPPQLPCWEWSGVLPQTCRAPSTRPQAQVASGQAAGTCDEKPADRSRLICLEKHCSTSNAPLGRESPMNGTAPMAGSRVRAPVPAPVMQQGVQEGALRNTGSTRPPSPAGRVALLP